MDRNIPKDENGVSAFSAGYRSAGYRNGGLAMVNMLGMRRLWWLLLISLLLTACASAQTGGDASGDDSLAALDLPPLFLYRFGPQFSFGDRPMVMEMDTATGQTEIRSLLPNPEVEQVLGQPNLLFTDRMIGQDLAYFPLPEGWPSPNGLWHARCEGSALHIRPVNGVESALAVTGCAPLWSPDGQRLIFLSPLGIHLATLDPAQPRQALPSLLVPLEEVEGVELLAWSPNSQEFVYAQGGQVIRQLVGGGARPLSLDARQVRQIEWSPDGGALFLRYGRGDWVRTPGNERPQLVGIIRYDLEMDRLSEVVAPGRLSGALNFAASPWGDALAVWYAECRLVLSELLPLLTLECSSQLRLVPVNAPQAWVALGQAEVARTQIIPRLRWADWQPPVAQLPVAQTPAERPDASPEEAGDAPMSAPGHSPQQPIPWGESGGMGNYSYRILETLRGEEATRLIEESQSGGSLGMDPFPGYEHMAIRLAATHQQGDAFSLGVTFFPRLLGSEWSGGRHLFLIDPADGQERLQVRGAGTVEVWLPFLIRAGEENPVLLVPNVLSTRTPLYLAAAPDAALPAARPRLALPANRLGVASAAAQGEWAISRDWQVQIRQVASQVVGPSAPGWARFLAGVELIYQGEEFRCVTPEFQAQNPARSLGMTAFMRVTMPGLRQVCFLPGGRYEGWLFLEAQAQVETVTLAFVPGEGDPIGPRFLAIPIPAPGSQAMGADPEPSAPLMSRFAPLAAGEAVEIDGLGYQILDVVRGENATQRLLGAMSLNQPPRAGREYVLVQMRVEHPDREEQAEALPVPTFGLTGDAHVLYSSRFAGLTPILPRTVEPGSGGEGWLSFEVAAEESGLVLVAPLPPDRDLAQSYFLALAGSQGPGPPDLSPVTPNRVGLTLANPAGLGEVAITPGWAVQLVQIIRGEEAWDRVQAANPNNQPPPEGMEYVLARLSLTLLAGDVARPVRVSGISLLRVVDGRGERVESLSAVAPEPRLDGALFPGGSLEGWIARLAPVNQPALLSFGDAFGPDGERYFRIDE
jgi:hypothetical protein